MTNAQLDAFTAEQPYTTTVTTVTAADGISTLATEKAPARVEYYGVSGARTTTPNKGIYLKRSVDANGTVTTQKVRY